MSQSQPPTIRHPLTEETVLDYSDAVVEVPEQNATLDYGELAFTREVLDNYDQHHLRRMAAHAPTDEVSGRSTRLEITSFFAVQYTLTDYE